MKMRNSRYYQIAMLLWLIMAYEANLPWVALMFLFFAMVNMVLCIIYVIHEWKEPREEKVLE